MTVMSNCANRFKCVENVNTGIDTLEPEVILMENEDVKSEADWCVADAKNNLELVIVKNELLQEESLYESGYNTPKKEISTSCAELNNRHDSSTASGSGLSSAKVEKDADNPSFPQTNKQMFRVCEECGRVFKKPSKLKSHLLVHTGEKPFKCEVCNRGFKSVYHLKTHCKIHTGEMPYVCNVCGKEFSQPRHLRTHTLIHTSEKPYACKVCNREFAQLGNLNKHALIHTGEKPHVCTVCNKPFSRLDNLKTHSLIHTGEKPHVCEVCGKSFQHGSNFLKHKQIHTRD